MTIGGFQITKKKVIVIGIIILVIVLVSAVKKQAEQKEIERRLAESRKEPTTSAPTTEYDFDEQYQAKLREKYGEPPEGFEWDALGNLVATTGDDSLSCEDVVYTYLRSLSILDFATALRYAEKSTVADTYTQYYSDVTAEIADYYRDFLRKQYKMALTTLEIENISSSALMPDGSQYVSVDLNVMDLTNKDFWLEEKDKIFDTMYTYDITETDGTKMEQYVYDYIYDAYERGLVGKKKITIELVVSKGNGEGWLISNDGELSHQLSYEWGTDVATYIKTQYQGYSIDRQVQEKSYDYGDDDASDDMGEISSDTESSTDESTDVQTTEVATTEEVE